VVVDDRNVRYEGEETALTPLGSRLFAKMGINKKTHVNGAKCFTYKDESIWNRRDRLESEEKKRLAKIDE